MSGVIFLVKDNNGLVELHEEPYEKIIFKD